MERLEISVINSSICENIVDFRIDADTYKKEYLREEKILKGLKSKTIEDVITSIQNFGAYSLCNEINFVEDGIPFLMTQNVRDNYISWDNIRHVDKRSHEMLYKSHCKKNQVLITMAGEYLGKAAVYDKDFISSSNQAVAKLTLKDDYYPYYVSTFINSKYGQNQISRFRTRTGQPNINMGLIKGLLIPYMSKEFSVKIENCVLKAQEILSTANCMYDEATTMLEKEVGIDASSLPNDNISIKTFSESFGKRGRIDSEYYQKKYGKLVELIKLTKHDTLLNLVNISKSIEPGSEAYREEGIPFIRVSDISKYEISTPDKYLEPGGAYDKPNLYLRKEEILFSKDGSVGIAYKIENDVTMISSSALLHLSVKDKNEILPDYLTAVLNSEIVQLQAQRDAGGSVINHWKPGEIEEVLIPILDIEKQIEVSDKVKKSFEYRKIGKDYLEVAKTAVEFAIENGEKNATKWLDEKMK